MAVRWPVFRPICPPFQWRRNAPGQACGLCVYTNGSPDASDFPHRSVRFMGPLIPTDGACTGVKPSMVQRYQRNHFTPPAMTVIYHLVSAGGISQISHNPSTLNIEYSLERYLSTPNTRNFRDLVTLYPRSRVPTLIGHCEEHPLIPSLSRDVAISMGLNTRWRTAVATATGLPRSARNDRLLRSQ